MTDRESFITAILSGDLDSAGVFADWLEEQDSWDDRYLGKYLRRRWRRWIKERDVQSLGKFPRRLRRRSRVVWENSPGTGHREAIRLYLRDLDAVFLRCSCGISGSGLEICLSRRDRTISPSLPSRQSFPGFAG